MTIDVIICTYNRPKKVMELVDQLMSLQNEFTKLIIVDSSDSDIDELKNREKVIYIKSWHKNQPYQRYLGYLRSNADFILYLDDDMELAKETVFVKLKSEIQKTSKLSGIAIHFEDKHSNTSLNEVPKSELFQKKGYFKKIIQWITAYPILEDGKFGLCGNRGKQPILGGGTEWVSGGAFLAKREALFQNFNFQLFDLFENKLGMGEDAIIGYGLSKQGALIYHPELLFYHNDQRDSSYSVNQYEFAKKVIYSRMYLSLEKSRIDESGYLFPKFHYHWYVFCRILGLMINYALKRDTVRKNILAGAISGWIQAFDFKILDADKSVIK